MKIFRLVLLMSIFLIGNPLWAENSIVGVWASPDMKSAKVLWYFFPSGKILTSTNASYNKHNLRWAVKDNAILIADMNKRFLRMWLGAIRDQKNIVGEQVFFNYDEPKADSWRGEKISDTPFQYVNFYALCMSQSRFVKVVNVGEFNECSSLISGKGSYSFSRVEVSKACESFFADERNDNFKGVCR